MIDPSNPDGQDVASASSPLGNPELLILLCVVGMLMGITLHRSAFGFSGAYRAAFETGETGGVAAQLLMVGLASALFAPLLSIGEAFGRPLVGATAPVGFSVAIGSFLFGMGMQLSAGCASGTLYALGGGSPRAAVTLAGFCAGSFVASLHMNFWAATPAADLPTLTELLGWVPAVALQGSVLALVWLALRGWARRRASPTGTPPGRNRRLILAAVVLALLNTATLVLAGHPWSITWAFTLWSAKVARALGWDPTGSAFWMMPFQQEALVASVFADVTSLMIFGLVAGAALSAARQGRRPAGIPFGTGAAAAALAGGLLMGYGARIAYGCNIGAFFSGVASTSLHGWLWIACALPGNYIAIRAIRFFAQRNAPLARSATP